MALAAAASSLTLAAAQKSASNAPQPGGSWTLQAGREVCPMGNQGDQGKQVCQGAHAMQLVELRLQLLVDRRVFEALVVPVITLKHHSCGLWLQVEQIHECEDKRSNRGTHGQAQSPSREDHNSSAQGAQLEVLWKELGLQGAKLLPREILEHGQACYEGGPDVGPKPDAIGGEVDHARGRHDLPSADSAQRQHQAAEEGPVPQRRSHKLSRVVQLPYHGLLRVQLTQGPVAVAAARNVALELLWPTRTATAAAASATSPAPSQELPVGLTAFTASPGVRSSVSAPRRRVLGGGANEHRCLSRAAGTLNAQATQPSTPRKKVKERRRAEGRGQVLK
eukprot:CAMPEP_0171069708 /NCGR_PEP_ID=MMETSP0766_2-20121228/9315_1 /TAXON_ID=439317 /ORGANISM="Gambierdiscus australes, Strain CAWD 149" /LENGTH=335 /DNA_ID=CAMNT_0011526121 /DNA_START=111 /DNA_END=1116 /DNA_ORIENTATION=+